MYKILVALILPIKYINEVNPGRNHYSSLILFIKLLQVTKEETWMMNSTKLEKDLKTVRQLRCSFVSFREIYVLCIQLILK